LIRAAAALALALVAGSASADPIDIRATEIQLNPRDSTQRTVGSLEFLAGYELTSESEYWGGLSGAVITPDGAELTAIADTGRWYRIGLVHDGAGRLTGLASAESGWLLNTEGQPPRKKVNGDAEAVAALPDGSLLIAYENRPRLWLYKNVGGGALLQPAVVAGAPKDIARLPRNGGIEAMARLPSGEYLIFSESGIAKDGNRLGWVGRRGKWSELRLAPLGDFEPSDLTLLPGGDLLLLERRVNFLEGFVNRLSRIDAATVKAGAVLQPLQVALLAAPLSVDNFEAVAARSAPDGSTLIYLLSDDNQRMLQRTLLLQFRLKN
jgi:hypothetical protein